jgi:hypothetical protein
MIMERHPDAVWKCAFKELIRAAGGDPNSDVDSILPENVSEEDIERNIDPSERVAPWGCPNGHRRRLLMRNWWLPPKDVVESRARKVGRFNNIFEGRSV